MTDKPQPAVPTDVAEEKKDPTLNARRILTWAISIALGVVITAVLMLATNIPLDSVLLLSFVNVPFLPLAALPVVLLVFIWVDYFMGTRILPD